MPKNSKSAKLTGIYTPGFCIRTEEFLEKRKNSIKKYKIICNFRFVVVYWYG